MKKNLSRIYMGLVFIFLYAPIVVLIIFSFNESKSRGSWDGFSLKWYAALLEDRQILKAMYYTIAVAVLSAVISTVVGTAAALGISNMKPLAGKTVMNISYIPVVSPDIVMGISLMILFIFSKIKLGFPTLLAAHITFNLPYVVLSVLPKINQLDKNLYEAALDLGASPGEAFRKVILPQLKPGIFTGALLAFTLSLDDFVVSFFTTGSGVNTVSIVVYSMARLGISPKINAISTIMFTLVISLLIIIYKRSREDIL